jgi:DHA3 family macrolide efflux protein-like MFS transporter
MSIVEVAWGIGMLAGGSILGIFKPKINKVVILNCMHLLLGLEQAYSGLLPANGYTYFVVLTNVGGLAAAVFSASFTTIVQEKIEPALLGRVFSMYFSLALLPSIIGLLGTGYIADHIGVDLAFVILGSIIALIGVLSFFVPTLMGLGKREHISE